MKSGLSLLSVLSVVVLVGLIFAVLITTSSGAPAAVATVSPITEPAAITSTPYPTRSGVASPRPIETVVAWGLTQDVLETRVALTPLPTDLPWASGIYSGTGDPLAVAWKKQGIDVTNIVVGYFPNGDMYVANVFVTVSGNASGVILQREYGNGQTGGQVNTDDFYPDLSAVTDHGGRIELVSSDGRTLFFDVPGMVFVDTLDKPVAVWTPGSPLPGSWAAGYPAPPIEVTALTAVVAP